MIPKGKLALVIGELVVAVVDVMFCPLVLGVVAGMVESHGWWFLNILPAFRSRSYRAFLLTTTVMTVAFDAGGRHSVSDNHAC